MAINAQLADHGIGIVGLPRDEAVDVAILERGQQWRPERSEAHHLDLAWSTLCCLSRARNTMSTAPFGAVPSDFPSRSFQIFTLSSTCGARTRLPGAT